MRAQIALLLVLALTATASATAQDLSWGLVMDGGPRIRFDRCAEVGSATEVVVVTVPGGGSTTIPGRTSTLDLVCVRDVDDQVALADWRQQVEEGEVGLARRDGCLQLLDGDGMLTAVWSLAAAWPSALEHEVTAGLATETAVVAHEGLLRVIGAPTAAADDEYETEIDTPLVVAAPGVLGNDSGSACGTLVAEVVEPPTGATLVLAADGGFELDPDPGQSGIPAFRYRACTGFDCRLAEVRVGVGVPVPLTLQQIAVE